MNRDEDGGGGVNRKVCITFAKLISSSCIR